MATEDFRELTLSFPGTLESPDHNYVHQACEDAWPGFGPTPGGDFIPHLKSRIGKNSVLVRVSCWLHNCLQLGRPGTICRISIGSKVLSNPKPNNSCYDGRTVPRENKGNSYRLSAFSGILK